MLVTTTRLRKKNKVPKKIKQRKIREIIKDGAEVDGANLTVWIDGIQYSYEVKDL